MPIQASRIQVDFLERSCHHVVMVAGHHWKKNAPFLKARLFYLLFSDSQCLWSQYFGVHGASHTEPQLNALSSCKATSLTISFLLT